MKRDKQLMLCVRLYTVRCAGFGDIQVQAGTPAAAKYQVFKKAREAGFFNRVGGFRDFLSRGWSAREVRR